jgi:cell division protein ZapD
MHCGTKCNRQRSPSGYDGALRPNARSPHRPRVILYEYPFNERIRTYLRLEHLFRRLGELIPRSHPLDHHYALGTIFEVMDVGARADLKSDVLKDLERQKQVLNGYRGNPGVAEAVLDKIVTQMESCFSAVNGTPGKAGQSLTENEWLMSIRSRAGIPGGDSGMPQKEMASAGQLQQTLPQGRTFQLLRLRIDPTLGLVPEISGNRLIVSVRLMRQESDRLQSSSDNTPFELTLCA